MQIIEYGPNKNKSFPTPKSVENFYYNGFMVRSEEGFAEYEVMSLIKWTNDPGIGLFLCSDNKERLIPSCQLTTEFLSTVEKCPKLNPFEGNGVFFGQSSKS